jgi:hypothetical protein
MGEPQTREILTVEREEQRFNDYLPMVRRNGRLILL